jgi:hypothetical protein
MARMVARNPGGRNFQSVLHWMGLRAGSGCIAGTLARVDKLTSYKVYVILFKLPVGDRHCPMVHNVAKKMVIPCLCSSFVNFLPFSYLKNKFSLPVRFVHWSPAATAMS